MDMGDRVVHRIRNLAPAALAAVVLACGDSGGPTALPPVPDIVQSVEIEAPQPARVEVGLPLDLPVAPRDANGILVPGARVIWSSLDPAVATVDSTGTVQPLAPGSVRVVAAVGAAADTVTLEAVAPLDLVGVDASSNHICGLTRDGSAYCWGSNDWGQLGDGTTTASDRPVAVSGGHRFASISAGLWHTCAVTPLGAAYCWGYGRWGQLGTGSYESSSVPVTVASGKVFRSISTGTSHTCGVIASGEGLCWGLGTNGQLGDGLLATSNTPVRIAGDLSFEAVSAGGSYTCGLAEGGVVYCWGIGDINNGPATGPVVPMPVADAPAFTSISTGTHHFCGLTSEGRAFCWGRNYYGELGVGTFASYNNDYHAVKTPQEVVGGHSFTSIVAGDSRTCAVSTEGQALCWGAGQRGAFGTDDPFKVNRPTPVPLGAVSGVTVGSTRGCAVTPQGRAWCWGDNSSGGLGAGDSAWSLAPRRVTIP